jgi:3-deoxy-manno-octulosonate cytidylyltransferase (CMP-KDO synthetase)
MSFVVVIPARYQSSRLPEKMLLDIGGKPMVLRVVERALQSKASKVYVATDDERIRSVCQEAGVAVLMTNPAHASGTDRIAEVAQQLGLGADAVIVNVQGDEPLIPPAVIDQVAANIAARPDTGICTLYAPVVDEAEFRNPNAVKLVTDAQGRVLYFSRAPIPWPRDGFTTASLALAKRHIGLYAYRVDVLRKFTTWPVSPLEETEKLEQLRAMHHGIVIHAERSCEFIPPGVDTAADLEHVRSLLRQREAKREEPAR